MRNNLIDLLINTARSVGLAALAVLLAIASASANDSSVSLDADGLQFTYNPDIKVESEDLSLSLEEVRVAYRFHNTSDRDISTLVAFPRMSARKAITCSRRTVIRSTS